MEQIGLEGKFEVSAFTAGLNAYLDGLARAETATTGAVSSLNQINAVVNALGQSAGNLGAASNGLSSIVNDLGKLSAVGASSNVPQMLTQLETALRGFGQGSAVESSATSLNDLAYALDAISHINLDPAKLNSVGGGLTTLVTDLSQTGNLSAVSTTLTSLTNTLNNLSSIQFDSTGLDSVRTVLADFGKIKDLPSIGTNVADIGAALHLLGGVQAVPQATLDSIDNLNLVLADLAGVKSVSGLGKAIGDVSNALNQLSAVQPVPQQVLASISEINLVFADLANVPKIGNLGASFASVSSALASLNSIKPIDPTALTSITELNQVLAGLANLPTIGNIGSQLARVSAALSSLGGIKPIDLTALDSVNQLTTVLTGLASLPTIGNIGSQLGRVSAALTTLGNVQPISNEALSAVTQLNTLLADLGSLPSLGNIGSQLGRVSSALNSLGSIKAINPQAIASIGGLSTALSGLSSLPNLGNIGSQLGRVSTALGGLGTIQPVPPAVITSISGLVTALTGVAGLGNIGTAVSGISNLAAGLNKLSTVQPLNAQVLTNIQQLGTALQGIGSGGNLGGFIQNLSQVSASMSNFGNTAVTTAQQTNTLGSALQNGLAVGIGVQAINMFTNLANSIRLAGQEAFNTVAYFEQLQFTITAVVADNLRASDSSLSFADALQKAQVPAEGVLHVLDKISLLSPFSPIDVDRAFKTATAYGLTANEALRLTKAFTDFAAARGLPADNLNRISLAVSQISAKGKLAAQEMNQLAEAGVPIRAILADAFHLTTKQLEDLMEKGAVPANDAISAIINNFEKYAGSAERATFTFTGLVSTLQEIKQLGERDLFGAAFAPLQPLLKQFVSFASGEGFEAGLRVIGELVGTQVAGAVQSLTASVNGLISGWQALNPQVKEGAIVFALAAAATIAAITAFGGLELIIGGLINPFSVIIAAVGLLAAAWVENFGGIQQFTFGVIGSISDALSSVAQEAVLWGQNIVDSLAAGIEGAVSLVLQALSVVGQAIQYMLEPGSPPRLLPDLDVWGAGAASAYLEGFKSADFSFLDQFGNLISSHLRNLAGQGKISEDSLTDRLVGSRTALEDAISQIAKVGSVTEDTVNRIAKNAKLSKEAVTSYLSDYINVRAATEAVNTAQQALNQTLKVYDAQINPLQAHLDSLKKNSQSLDDQKKIAQLQRTINNVGISDARRKSAQLELDELLTQRQIESLTEQKKAAQDSGQAKVDAATSALDAAKDQLDLLQKQSQEALNLEGIYQALAKTQADMNNDLTERAKKFDAELDPLNKQLKAFQLQSEALKDHVREAELKAILEDKTATAAQKAAAQFELQELSVRRQIRDVEASRLAKEGFVVDLASIEKIPVVLADIAKKGKAVKPILDSVFGKFQGVSNASISKALEDFNHTLEQTRTKVMGLGNSFAPLLDHIDKALPKFLSLKAGIDGVVPAVNAIKTAFELFATFFASTRLIAILQEFPSILGVILTKTNLIGAVISLVAVAWFNDWFGIREVTASAVDYIRKKFVELTGITGLEDVKTKLGEFFSVIRGYLTNPNTFVGSTVTKGTGFIQAFVNDHFSKDSIASALEVVKTNLGGFFTTVQSYFNDPATLGGQAKTALTTQVGYIEKWVSDHFNQAAVTTALGEVSALLTTFFAGVQAYFDDPSTLGGQAKTAVETQVGYIEKWVSDHFNQATVDTALANVSTTLQAFFQGVQAYFDDPSTLGGQAKTAVTTQVGYIEKWVSDHFNQATVDAALTNVSTLLTTFFAGVQAYFDDPSTLGAAAKKTAETGVDYLTTFINDHFSKTQVDAAIANIEATLTTFFATVQGYLDDPTSIGGAVKKAATVVYDYLKTFVEAHFGTTQIEETLANVGKIISDFKSKVQAELEKSPVAAPTSSGAGGGGGFGGESETLLDRFMESNFGTTAVGKALGFLVEQWSKTVSIIVNDLFNPIGEAIDKDQGLSLGSRIGNFLIRAFGISLGATIKYILGVFIPQLVFSLVGIYYAVNLFLTTTLPAAFKAGVTGLVNYLTHDAGAALKDAANSVAKGFIEGMDLMFEAFGLQKFSTIFGNFMANVKGKFGELKTYIMVTFPQDLASAGSTIIGAITGSIQSFLQLTGLTRLTTIASEIISGLLGGLSKAIDVLVPDEIPKALGKIYQAILDFFGIKSPSTKMSDGVGEPMGAGLFGGLSTSLTSAENIAKVVGNLTSLVGSMFSAENVAKFTDAAFSLGKSIYDNISKGVNSLVTGGTNLLSNLFGGSGDAASKGSTDATDDAAKKLKAAMATLAGTVNSDDITLSLNRILLGFLSLQESATSQIQLLAQNVLDSMTQLNTDVQVPLLVIETTFLNDFEFIKVQVGLKMTAMHTETNATLDAMNTDAQAKLQDMANKCVAILVKLHKDAIEAINGMKKDIVAAFSSLRDDVLTKIGDLKDKVVQIFKDIASESIAVMKQFKTDLFDQLDSIMKDIKDKFLSAGKEVGNAFGDGIAQGIRDKIEAIKKAAKDAADAAKQAAKDTVEAKSPAKALFREVGQPFSQGIAKGILAEMDTIIKAATSVAQAGVDAAYMVAQRTGSTSNGISSIANNRTNIFNLNVNSYQSSQSITQDFGVMQVMV